MSYKGKVKVYQQVEDYKAPSEKPAECKKSFDEYCVENNITTRSQKACSARNPIYYDFLLDYVGYIAGAKKDDPYIEATRSTYIKAAGRFVMLRRVADEYSEEFKCQTRVVTPPAQFMPVNNPSVAICTAEVRIEALIAGEWEIIYSGTGTAKRQGSGYSNDFFIEKAETAARARAVAAAGIGVDIQGGLSTIEDALAAYAEEENKPDDSEKMQVQALESKIRDCENAEDPIKSINDVAKGMKEDAKALSKQAQAHLSNVFEEVLAKINQKKDGGKDS